MDDPDRSLELSREEMAELVAAAADSVLDHLETLPEQDAASVDDGDDLFEHLREPIPTSPPRSRSSSTTSSRT